MFSLNTHTNKALRSDLNVAVKSAITTMYKNSSVISNEVRDHFNKSITKATVSRAALATEYPVVQKLNTIVDETAYKLSIKLFDNETRKAAWRYRAYEIRIVLLKTILANPKKLSYLINDTLEAVLRGSLNTGKNEVTISQVVHTMKLTSDTYADRLGNTHPITPWGIDELRLQLINELCELDLLDMRVSHKTHMVSIPDSYTDLVTREEWIGMSLMTKYLSRKTILLEPAPIDTNMISRSSWWYNTPVLAPDQIKFIETMHSLKWEFVEDAEILIEEAFKAHLKVDTLPVWALDRVEEYRYQIRASNANGGHYIAGKFDSALRWYWQAEIGHTQTSEHLRHLVRPAGMVNPTKYDMSNNVVQMYAIGLQDRGLGKYVSLVPQEDCVTDLRLLLAQHMNSQLGIEVFNKDNIKPIFMIWAYNAGKQRLLDGVYTEEQNFFTGKMERVLKTAGLRDLVATSGKSISDDTVWNTFQSVLATLVPSIFELKRIMSRIVKANPFTETSWTLPDGAIAQYASVVTEEKQLHWVSSDGKMRQHTHHRKSLEANAKASGLLPRSIHSLDAYLARTLVIRAAALGIVVVPNHDSFMFDEVHTDTMFRLVRELFVEIMEGHYLYDVVQQLNAKGIKENGEYLDREVLTAEDIMSSSPMKLEEL